MRYEGPQRGHYYRTDEARMSVNSFRQYALEGVFNHRNLNFQQSLPEKKPISPVANFIAILIAGLFIATVICGFMQKFDLFFYGFAFILVTVCVLMIITSSDYGPILKVFLRIGCSAGIILVLTAITVFYLYNAGKVVIDEVMALRLGSIGIFSIVILIIVLTIVYRFMMKNRCTEEIMAECIGFEDKLATSGRKHHRTQHVVSMPVYKFYYQGSDYIIHDGMYFKDENNLPRYGEKVDVKIDPECPELCVIRGRYFHLAPLILIACVLLMFAVGMGLAGVLQ